MPLVGMRPFAFAVAVLSLVVGAGCPHVDPPIPPPNPPIDTDWCAQMCTHLQTLKCEEGEKVYNNDLPGPAGVPNQTCAENCVELQDKGFFVNPRCVATVRTCDEIETVRQKEAATCGSTQP